MNTWYKVEGFRWAYGRITPVEIHKATSARVWSNAVHYKNKLSEYHAYFETEAEAVEYLRQCAVRRRDYHKKIADEGNAFLAKLDLAFPQPS